MKLAICYQSVQPASGGAETYVADLCRGLCAAGHDVLLFAEAWSSADLPAAMRTVRIEPEGRSFHARTWSFARKCEAALIDARSRIDCSIGFINTWGTDILIPQGGVRRASLAANAMRYASIPARWCYTAGKRLNPKWWLYQAIEREQYRPSRGTRFVAVSHMVKHHLRQYHAVPEERIDVIPNAIDARRLEVVDRPGLRKAFRDHVGLTDSDLIALFVGHNYRLKGLGPLIKALAVHHGRGGRRMHLVVCGKGRAKPFQRIAARLGQAECIHFAGFLPDVRAAFQGSDLFVLPTYYDPCSLVVFEALAAGLPVITTRCNGASELITNAIEGFVIDRPDQIDALAVALGQTTHDTLRHRMSDRATILGRAQSFENHISRLLELAERIASKRRGAVVRAPHSELPRAAIRTG